MPTKTFALLIMIGSLVVQVTDAWAQNVSWVRQFGTSGIDLAEGIAAASNHVYVTGRVALDLALPGQVSAGGRDVFVRTYDAKGTEVWTKQFGTSAFDGFAKIAIHQGNLYVAGITTGTFSGQSSIGGSDIFIRQYDTDGNEAWTRQLGTTELEFFLGIAAHKSGVYIFGTTTGVFPGQTSAGGEDFFLLKLDFTGNPVWVRQFGTSGDDNAVGVGGIAVDDTGIYVGSDVPGALALPGQSSVGGFADVFLRKYDFEGSEVWTTQFGTACGENLFAVAVDSGGVYVVGGTQGDMVDPFLPRCTNPSSPNSNDPAPKSYVQRRTTDGALVWTQQYEGPSSGAGFS